MTGIGDYAFQNAGLEKAVIKRRDTIISKNAFSSPDKTAICGYEGSTAQTYAETNGFTFVPYVQPVIATQPQSVRVALGNQVNFDVVAVGEDLHYQWQYKASGATSWTEWTGKTAATLSFTGTSANNGAQYRCVVSNEAGSVSSEAATLTVISEPVITSQPKSARVALGKSVTFALTATGENLTYQWYYKKVDQSDWTKWVNKTTASIKVTGSGTNDGCQYRCVVSNEDGSVSSEAATLTVISEPVITSQPESASVALGTSVTFALTATGENLTYQWYYKKVGQSDWTKWTNRTAASIKVTASGTNDGCQYRCVVSNEAGSVSSEAATLKVTANN